MHVHTPWHTLASIAVTAATAVTAVTAAVYLAIRSCRRVRACVRVRVCVCVRSRPAASCCVPLSQTLARVTLAMAACEHVASAHTSADYRMDLLPTCGLWAVGCGLWHMLCAAVCCVCAYSVAPACAKSSEALANQSGLVLSRKTVSQPSPHATPGARHGTQTFGALLVFGAMRHRNAGLQISADAALRACQEPVRTCQEFLRSYALGFNPVLVRWH